MNELLNASTSLAKLMGATTAETPDMGMTEAAFFDPEAIIFLLLRFGFHMLICFFIIRYCYYPKSRNRDYSKSFTFFAAGMFLLLFLLESIKLQIGLTLGLFAIFGVIRYRTETVPIKEMTYLFMIIVTSVINGLSLNISFIELMLANIMMVAIMYVFENHKVKDRVYTKMVLYERIELIVPERREELKEDLKERTGLDIVRVEVGHIDFMRDAAFVRIHFRSDTAEDSSFGTMTKLKP